MDTSTNNRDIKSVAPPASVFVKEPITGEEKIMTGASSMHIFTGRVTVPPEGGMNLWYKDVPFPKKGFHFPQAAFAINIVKKITMMAVLSISSKSMILPAVGFFLTPFSKKVKIIENALIRYNRMANYLLDEIYLKPEYMTPCAQQIKIFLQTFLMSIGITDYVATNTGNIFAHLIEHDDAYRYRIEDIMSETTQEKMFDYPVDEIEKLFRLYVERQDAATKYHDEEMADKFGSFRKITTFLLLSFKFRNAFKTAIAQTNFKYLQLDEADHYHCLNRADYNFFGKSIEERMKEYEAIHKGNYPPMVEYK